MKKILIGTGIALVATAIAVPVITADSGHPLSNGDKMEIAGQANMTDMHHGGHTANEDIPSDLNPATDTGVTGIPSEKGGHRFPTDVSGCAWYHDVAGMTVCVPNPLPKKVTGAKACDYLRDQGYGPLTVLKDANKSKSDDPLKIDDNGDGTACYGGDFGTPAAPPDESGAGIVESNHT